MEPTTAERIVIDDSTAEATTQEYLGEPDPNVDVDLTVMGRDMVYATVYQMMLSPEDFIGKKVKCRGQFAAYWFENTSKWYSYCIIQDALACCQQGLEFSWDDGNHDIAIATSLYMVLFYVQLFMRSLEYPLIVRFGGKMGNVVKMVLIAAVVLGGAVYLLFGDLSPFADMSSFWDRLFEALEDSEAVGKIALGTGIAAVGITVLYYLSYRLSVKWYLKGVDHYAK